MNAIIPSWSLKKKYPIITLVLAWILLTPFYPVAASQAEWELLTRKATSDFEQESYEQAVSNAIKALEYAESNFGRQHPLTITSSYLLASFYSQLAYPDQAIPLLEQALELAISQFGENQSDTVLIMESLAQIYAEQARYEDALPLLEKVFTFKRLNQGESDADTLLAMVTLARAKQGKGLLPEAEKLYQNAILLSENSLGPNHPDTLAAKENLASVYKTQGKFKKAGDLLQTIYDAKAALLGEKNPETLITLGSLAEIYHKTGTYDQAETFYLKAIDHFNVAEGESDPELYGLMSNLATLYQDQGRYAEAEKMFLTVYTYDKKLLGETHPNTIIDLNNLAGIYRVQGKYGKSEEAYVRALSMIRASLGERHPETISVMNNLALLFENQGFFDQAEPLFKTALNYAGEALGTKHPTTLALMNNLASLYESQGVFDRSEAMYRKTIQLNTQVYGSDHANTIAGINNLAYLYLVQKQYGKAEPLFLKVYEQWRLQLGDRHQKTLKSLNNLARAYHWQGNVVQAEAMFMDSLRLRKETLGAKHPDVVRSMVDLSALYITRQKYKAAETLLIQAIALAEEVLGDKHEYTFEAVNNLGRLYELSGQTKKSLATMQKGFERRTEFFESVLWAAGENTRQSYIDLHRPEQHRFLKTLLHVNNREAALMALNVSTQRKSLLLKISSEIQKIVQLTRSPDLSAKADALNRKRKKLAALTLSGPVTETPAEFRKTIANLETELNELQADIGRISRLYRLTTQPISVENIFTNLDPGDVLIDYMTFKDDSEKMFAVIAQTDVQKCFVWWECSDNHVNMIDLGDLSDIKKAVDIFRETIQDEETEEEDILETGFDVYKLVWQPLLPYLNNKTSIYVVPDSILHLLPFDALVNENDNFLIESIDLRILSSSRDLVVSSLPDAQGEFLILAGPDYDLEDTKQKKQKRIIADKRSATTRGLRLAHGLRSLSFEPLLGAEIEGKTIKQVSDAFEALPGSKTEGNTIMALAQDNSGSTVIFLDQDAKEEQLRVLPKSPRVIHIATHGFFLKAEERLKKRLLSIQRGGLQTTPPPGDNPLLRAGLAFAGINANAPFLGEIDTDNDGVLTAMEVLSLNLSGTRLVVLSACETGVGEIHAGEGVYGLRRAFQEAGVKNVVNSLWPVSDEGTRRLMTSFYKFLYDNQPPGKALKEAQLELINSEWSSPYYWASFVLVERRFSSNL